MLEDAKSRNRRMKGRAGRITEKWQKRNVESKKMERKIEEFEILEKAIS